MTRAIASVLLLFLGFAQAATATVQPAGAGDDLLDTRLAAIEKTIEEARQKLGVPGVAIAVVKDGRVILTKGFGLRDTDKALAVTPDTLFAIGSCTKAFTAMAAILAQDEGKLSLDDAPRQYLPYFKLRDPQGDAEVTLRDLLAHRTGLGRFDLAWITGVLTRQEVIEVAGRAVPTAKLRAHYQYQNTMYSAAGEAVGAANRSTWEAVVAERIFARLGMGHSNTSVKATQAASDFATGYRLEEDQAIAVPMRMLSNIAPAGAINSTAADMAQWLRLMLGRGRVDDRRLVSESGFSELLTPQIQMGGGMAYGLGWVLNEWRGHKMASHDGGIDGFNALVGLMPEEQLGFVVLTNVSASPLPRLAMQAIWSNLVEAAPEPATAGAQPAPAPPSAAAGTNTADEDFGITVEALQAGAIEAAGGEARLRQLQATTMQWRLTLENQGLEGDMTVHTQAPNSLSVKTTLLGLDKPIGTIHAHFDGTKGGEDSSFAPSRAYDERELEEYRIAANIHELLNWGSLYKAVRIAGKTEVNGEPAYVVIKTPAQAYPVTDYFSVDTFLLLKRDRRYPLPGGVGVIPLSETYGDYRTVEGAVVPFELVIHNPITGRTTAILKAARFDVDPKN